MKLTQLFDDDRAVSPVIGVILMVAITVILAAVIGTFVLGLGDQVQTTTPSASFQTDYTNNSAGDDSLEIAHGGGDTLTASQVTIAVGESFNNSAGTTFTNSDTWQNVGGTSEVSAGSSVTIQATNLADNTVRVTWSGESGDNSAVLAKWSGPDA